MATEKAKRDFRSDYDMTSPELAHDFPDVVKELHTGGCPMSRSEVGEGYWVLTNYADVTKTAGDWETFSSATGFMPDRPEGMPWLYPVESDPPFHTSLREALNPYFRPKVIQANEPAIRVHAETLVAEIKASEEPEIVSGFSNPLPGRVFCNTVAGMPIEDIPFLQKTLEDGIVGPPEGRGPAVMAAFDYMDRYLRDREGQPRRDDVVQAILDLDFEGFDWTAKVGTLTTLTLGGVGTTGFVFSAVVHYLADQPEVRRRLVEDEAYMRSAVEEFIRVFSASPQDGRRVTRETQLQGVDLSPGDYVLLNYGAASLDPEIFPEADQIDLERPLPNRHVAFGFGIHRCIGSHLARLDIRVGLETFFREIPDYRIPEGFVPEYEIGNTRVMKQLPIEIL